MPSDSFRLYTRILPDTEIFRMYNYVFESPSEPRRLAVCLLLVLTLVCADCASLLLYLPLNDNVTSAPSRNVSSPLGEA